MKTLFNDYRNDKVLQKIYSKYNKSKDQDSLTYCIDDLNTMEELLDFLYYDLGVNRQDIENPAYTHIVIDACVDDFDEDSAVTMEEDDYLIVSIS